MFLYYVYNKNQIGLIIKQINQPQLISVDFFLSNYAYNLISVEGATILWNKSISIGILKVQNKNTPHTSWRKNVHTNKFK